MVDLPTKVIDGLESALDETSLNAANGSTYTVTVTESPVRDLRKKLGKSPAEFARDFGVPVRTLEKWEQGSRTPDSTVQSYLKVIEEMPDAVIAALQTHRDRMVTSRDC
jgi:DNA-binding transcriptional regulator YiaG